MIVRVDSSYLQIGLTAIKSIKISFASLTVAELSSWQPLLSTIVKGYVPGNSEIKLWVRDPLSQINWYGSEPPIGFKIIVPSLKPKHSTSFTSINMFKSSV